MKSCRTVPLKDRQQKREYQFQYYRVENLTKTQAYYKKYYAKNRKRLLTKAKKWQKEHHNCYLQYQSDWNKKNGRYPNSKK